MLAIWVQCSMAGCSRGYRTQVDDNIKYGMIEAISHLIHRDYSAIVEDFVTLQFIPQGAAPALRVLASTKAEQPAASPQLMHCSRRARLALLKGACCCCRNRPVAHPARVGQGV